MNKSIEAKIIDKDGKVIKTIVLEHLAPRGEEKNPNVDFVPDNPELGKVHTSLQYWLAQKKEREMAMAR